MKSKMAVDQVLKRFSGKIVKEDAPKRFQILFVAHHAVDSEALT